MDSYEDLILARQESEAEDCTDCEHKENCRSQCMQEKKLYNPVIEAYLNRRKS